MKKKVQTSLFFILIGGIIIYMVNWRSSTLKDLKKNGVLIKNTLVVDVLSPGRGGTVPTFKCKFRYKSNSIIQTEFDPSIRKFKKLYVSHSFPALYSEKYKAIKLLMLPEDFAKYGLPYPDSLRWVDSLNKSR